MTDERISEKNRALIKSRPWGRGTGRWPVFEREMDDLLDAAREQGASSATPIKMVLHCPACGEQHIDAPDPPLDLADMNEMDAKHPGWTEWTNPPHRSHLCRGCGHIWRPADVPTEGVAATATKGKADSPAVSPPVRGAA